MGYLNELRAFISENPPDELPTIPTKPPIQSHSLGSVGFVSDPMAHVRGKKLIASWVASVRPLNVRQPPGGFDKVRWGQLVDASMWWLEHFGKQAALEGWSTGCVFGIREGHPGLGGLIDRIGNSRSLVMDGQRARWRTVVGTADRFNAGAYPDLSPFWQGKSRRVF